MDGLQTIQWVECSRCQKWRIIHPLPDGSDECIPEIWFCEMNKDSAHSSCEAPEEDYKVPEVALVPLPPVAAPKSHARLAKINDPESVRARLKQLSDDELQAAFEHVDMERVFLEEFGDKLVSGRSIEFISEVPLAAVSTSSTKSSSRNKSSTSSGKTAFDYNAAVDEVKSILESGKSVFPLSIMSQLTSRYS